jgi:UDP-N-acetylglucosamine 2-epimerase
MRYITTVTELVQLTKESLCELGQLVDIIHNQYNTAADIIDSTTDHRQKHLDQLQELHKTLSGLVELHPAQIDKLSTSVFSSIAEAVNKYDKVQQV